MKRIGLATAPEFASLTADDRLLLEPLRALGLEAEPLLWGGAAPEGLEAVVVRSCWDYHLRSRAFLTWLDALEQARVPLWNPARVCRWNLDKRYLRELAGRGVPVPETVWLEPGEAPALDALLARAGFAEAVVKPRISLSAHRTFRVRTGEGASRQVELAEAARESGALVQRYLPGIAEGELSLVYLGGELSHAVRKRPAPGDFRVQSDHGGTRQLEVAPPEARELAEAALGQAPGPLLYARVDLVLDAGRWLLMELELIDPELFLAFEPEAPARLARALAGRLAR